MRGYIHDDRFYPATLLDVDNQLVSSGKVLVHTSEAYASFSPSTGGDEAKILACATKLQIQEGLCFSLKLVMRCPGVLGGVGEHYQCLFG